MLECLGICVRSSVVQLIQALGSIEGCIRDVSRDESRDVSRDIVAMNHVSNVLGCPNPVKQ
eukprot:965682-Amorphochlora_amoeboformis.AAC.1